MTADESGDLSCAACGEYRPVISLAEYSGYFCEECLVLAADSLRILREHPPSSVPPCCG